MKRPRVLIVGVIVLVVVLVGGVIGWIRIANDVGHGLVVRASTSAQGFAAPNVLDAQKRGTAAGWRSQGQTVGSWLDLEWSSPRRLRSLDITASRSGARITAGVLQFDDGSALQADLTDGTTQISFGERQVRSLRFEVTGVSGAASFVGVHALALNTAVRKVVKDDGGDAVPAAALLGLTRSDGNLTAADPLNSTWTFQWSKPRELVAVELAGTSTGATIRRATLQFPGGATITIGSVPADPALPTKVAFLPRSVQSLSLRIDEVSGSGVLSLSALHLWERGARLTALRALPNGTTVSAPNSACPSTTATSPTTLQVVCPLNGSQVGDRTDLTVALPAPATGVRAEVWPSTADVTVAPIVVSGTGLVQVPLDFAGLPDGPVTVRLTAVGAGSLSASPTQFQLLHGYGSSASAPTSTAAAGKTLVWDDEFDAPVSVGRSGAEHRYAAGKSEPTGYSDFGDAIFADPSDGYGNIGTLERRYLRLDVRPVPAGFADPQGYNRKYIGAMLASAKPGGAGFSAQYGYFEARMLVPANPGTWPAFWLLPSSNLAAPKQPVAEIDAVELYGHDPTGACHTTHSYSDGKDSGGVALCGQRFASAQQALQWHTYGVAVEPTRIRYFIDGTQVASAAQVPGGERPMFFLINLALGGGWPVELSSTEQRAEMLVDWVRAYV